MQELAAVISLVLFFVVWWLIAKKLKPKKSLIVRNTLGLLGGFIVMIVSAALFIKGDDKSEKETDATVAEQISQKAAKPEPNPEIKPEPIKPAEPAQTVDIAEAIEQEKPTAASEKPEKNNAASLGLTPTEYLDNLNLSLQKVGLPIEVSTNAEVKSGAVNDTFTVNMGSNLVLSAAVAKSNGKLLSTTLIGAGDGTEESGYIIMLAAIASFMSAANATDEEGKETYSKIFFNLMEQVDASSDDSSPSSTADGVKYGIVPMGQMGTWFIAEAVDQK